MYYVNLCWICLNRNQLDDDGGSVIKASKTLIKTQSSVFAVFKAFMIPSWWLNIRVYIVCHCRQLCTYLYKQSFCLINKRAHFHSPCFDICPRSNSARCCSWQMHIQGWVAHHCSCCALFRYIFYHSNLLALVWYNILPVGMLCWNLFMNTTQLLLITVDSSVCFFILFTHTKKCTYPLMVVHNHLTHQF